MSANDVLKTINDDEVKFVDFRFTDTRGKEQHVSVPAHTINEEVFQSGKMFDGSSIAGWKGINESDMILMPDPATAVIDPFFSDSTMILRCDILEPSTMEGYGRDPRSVGKRAEAYLRSTGIADTAYFGPEPEFFIFDDVKWGNDMAGAFYQTDSDESAWNSAKSFEDGNIGHRPGVKGGYFPVPPVDSLQDARSAMCLVLEEMGVPVEVHHHEVGTVWQAAQRSREVSERATEVEVTRFSVGASTNYEVALAQALLTQARLTELRAIIDYVNAIAEFELVQYVG